MTIGCEVPNAGRPNRQPRIGVMRYLTAWFGFWVIFWVHLIVGVWLIFKRMEERRAR
jgi:paraquat-inducible protein B